MILLIFTPLPLFSCNFFKTLHLNVGKPCGREGEGVRKLNDLIKTMLKIEDLDKDHKMDDTYVMMI